MGTTAQGNRASARERADDRKEHWTPSLATIVGSAALWAWGFLAYLSPALFPAGRGAESTGIELGFFASQATVVVSAVLLIAISRRTVVTFGRGALLAAAGAMTLASLAIPAAIAAGAVGLLIGLGVVSGVAASLCGIAWGARYSLGSGHAPATILLSFLLAYGLYLATSCLIPFPFRALVVTALPLLSWAFWADDAAKRHRLSSSVFPTRSTGHHLHDENTMPGELLAGSWEARVMPWRAMGVIMMAALIGNLVSSAIMGFSYDQADSLYAGGVAVCACIVAMALVPLSGGEGAFSVSQLYRTTVTFSAAGLLGILVFGHQGMAAGGALVQGCAMFLQALVYVVVAQSTQREGLAPLLSFGIGQALVSTIVLAGNVLGKQLALMDGSDFVLHAACGAGVLILFLMMANQAAQGAGNLPTPEEAENGCPSQSDDGDGRPADGESAPGDQTETFAVTFGLTPRETEVLTLLGRGRSLPYIADTLFVTTGTVKTHVKHIYRKCNVSSRQELLDLLERESS